MDSIHKVKMEEAEKIIGSYIVLWRQDTKTACKVESIVKDTNKIVYEIISGSDKGKRYMSKYDPSQIIDIYDEGTVILAALNI